MRKLDRRYLSLPLLFAATFVLHGYDIAPLADVHEDMTRAAKHCLDAAGGTIPTDCAPRFLTEEEGEDVDVTWLHDSSIAFYDLPGWIRRWTGYDARYPTLREAVRWPDDPTRQFTVLGAVKAGITVKLRKCGASPEQGANISGGVLCNSHYGDMQFLHAQASSANEPAAVTHDKIMRWADFLFDVAAHMSNDELDEAYCRKFSGDDAFSRAMLPGGDAVPCGDTPDDGWGLTTLFTFRCSNPFSSRKCGAEDGPSQYDKSRIVAAGALMHLIQDSYSRSHCVRGECVPGGGRVAAKVECLPIQRFTTYQGQQNHGQADSRPNFEPSCDSENGIDDPITASAKVLWHIRNHSSPEKFRADLYRVFGTPEQAAALPPSSLGRCFGDPPAS